MKKLLFCGVLCAIPFVSFADDNNQNQGFQTPPRGASVVNQRQDLTPPPTPVKRRLTISRIHDINLVPDEGF